MSCDHVREQRTEYSGQPQTLKWWVGPATLFLTSLLLLACTDDGLVGLNKSDIALVPLAEGRQRQIVTRNDGTEWRYTVCVPHIPRGQDVPLVVALHQAGNITPYFSEIYLAGQVEPALRDLGAIIVAPDIPSSSWVDSYAEESIVDFIDIATEVWPIDRDRIVLTGYSAGGIGTWFLTGAHPNVFSAGMPVAAEPNSTTQHGAGSVPLFVVHGREDERFDIANVERIVNQLIAEGADIRLVIEEDLGHNNLSAFVPALSLAMDWLENDVWK